jgi:hypothetical protein
MSFTPRWMLPASLTSTTPSLCTGRSCYTGANTQKGSELCNVHRFRRGSGVWPQVAGVHTLQRCQLSGIGYSRAENVAQTATPYICLPTNIQLSQLRVHLGYCIPASHACSTARAGCNSSVTPLECIVMGRRKTLVNVESRLKTPCRCTAALVCTGYMPGDSPSQTVTRQCCQGTTRGDLCCHRMFAVTTGMCVWLARPEQGLNPCIQQPKNSTLSMQHVDFGGGRLKPARPSSLPRM